MVTRFAWYAGSHAQKFTFFSKWDIYVFEIRIARFCSCNWDDEEFVLVCSYFPLLFKIIDSSKFLIIPIALSVAILTKLLMI